MRKPIDSKSPQELLNADINLGFQEKSSLSVTDVADSVHAVDSNSSVIYVYTDKELLYSWGDDNSAATDADNSLILVPGLIQIPVPMELGNTPYIVFKCNKTGETADVRIVEG